jgi:predicted nuclease of predicted toxin-antitoxin system
VVDQLRADGHLVLYVAEMEPGISDNVVLEKANQESALLFTAEKDFGEIVFRQKQITKGIILTRLAGLTPQKKAEIISAVLKEHLEEIENAFTVIVPSAIRIRRSDW